MPFPNDHKYTAEEFFKLTAENDSERFELINGELLSQAAPSINHQRISMGLSVEIGGFIKNNKGRCEPFAAPTDVMLDNENIVQPDFFIVCDPSKINNDKRCIGAPDFIIEITSSNYGRDYIDKLALYRKSGVREYWIVDPLYERVMVYFFEESSSPYIYTFDMSVPVGIYDGKLTINFKDMI